MPLRDGTFYASLRDAQSRPYKGTYEDNSPDCMLMRTIGEIVTKTVNITAAGATVDLFTITGGVRIFGLGGKFTDVTDVADIDGAYWDLDDGAVQADLTNSAGTTLDGVSVDALILKVASAGTALTLLNSDQVRVDETDPKRLLYPFVVNGATGATNKIRFTYTSAAGCDATIVFALEWRHLLRHEDGSVAAA